MFTIEWLMTGLEDPIMGMEFATGEAESRAIAAYLESRLAARAARDCGRLSKSRPLANLEGLELNAGGDPEEQHAEVGNVFVDGKGEGKDVGDPNS